MRPYFGWDVKSVCYQKSWHVDADVKQMRPLKLSLRAQVLLVVSLVVTIGFAVCIGVVNLRAERAQKTLAIQYAEQIAQTNASIVSAQVAGAFNTLNDLSAALLAMKSQGVADRRAADEILKSVLKEHPSILGIGTVWEPNAFDGKDAAFVNTMATDATGRYISYWNRATGAIKVEPCTNYSVTGSDGDYYQKPRASGRSFVTEPYPSVSSGTAVTIMSLSLPIALGERFVGVVELDLSLASLNDTIRAIRPYETGYAMLISQAGQAIATGGNNTDSRQTALDITTSAKSSGIAASISEVDDTNRGRVVRVVVPISIGDTGQDWYFAVVVPESKVLASVHETQIVAVAIGILSVLLVSSVLLICVNRLVLHPLGGEPNDAAELAHRVANGDLTISSGLAHTRPSSVMGALLEMQRSLNRVASDVRRNADGVSVASAQIAHGSLELSARTEQQAAALEQTSATMEQLAATVKSNADVAKEASVLAAGATDAARASGRLMGDVMSTMEEINEDSNKVSDIISVIESIAFQTNILALNAAVEAARAGEQGRGFAVVAGEVRTLAQRAAASAKDVRSLVQASVGATDRGHQLVSRAGDAVSAVAREIEKVSSFMRAIAAASHEQSLGVEQVVTAVSEMDDATQRNAALVEESAAAAEALRSQAEVLQAAAATFKTSD